MKDYLLVLIYANWCGHCVNYKAVDKDGKSNWDRVKEAVKGDNDDVDIFEFESSVLEPFTELKENGKGTTEEDFNKKCSEIIKNKFEEFEKVKKSGSVDKNDLADLINDYDLLNKINIYDLLSFRGFPTLMVMKNEKLTRCFISIMVIFFEW